MKTHTQFSGIHLRQVLALRDDLMRRPPKTDLPKEVEASASSAETVEAASDPEEKAAPEEQQIEQPSELTEAPVKGRG